MNPCCLIHHSIISAADSKRNMHLCWISIQKIERFRHELHAALPAAYYGAAAGYSLVLGSFGAREVRILVEFSRHNSR